MVTSGKAIMRRRLKERTSLHSSDAMAIWVCQFVGREIRLLDYIQGVGQLLGFYATELRRRGCKDAIIHLPHDGVATTTFRATVISITQVSLGLALAPWPFDQRKLAPEQILGKMWRGPSP
jgi:hypothetical protein